MWRYNTRKLEKKKKRHKRAGVTNWLREIEMWLMTNFECAVKEIKEDYKVLGPGNLFVCHENFVRGNARLKESAGKERRRERTNRLGVVVRCGFNVEGSVSLFWSVETTMEQVSSCFHGNNNNNSPNNNRACVLGRQLYSRLVFYVRFMNAALPFERISP